LKELTVTSDAPGERLFVLGNEAIARGAIEAGVQVAAAYPGTPSSEILETLASVAKELDIYVEWSTNEKVAFEVALAASICGVRAMASMKHVGVNVAHDSLMTASYIGAKGGLVLLSADDPWAWSSQNEQDNRYIALQGYIPILEPSSVQEAKDMMADAFRLSEEFGHLFMVRSITRIGHARSDIVLGEISKERRKGYFKKDPSWLVYTPAGARKNKPLMIKRFERIKKAVNTLPYNQLRLADKAKLGIIACGLSYSYALEAIKWLGIEDKVSILKIGTPHPLPEELVKRLLNSVGEILVVEELEPFVELHVKAIAGGANIPVKIHGKDLLSVIGELSTRKVTEAIAKLTDSKLPVDFAALDKLAQEVAPLLPWRPPALCPGCPHRASFYAIKVAARRVARDYGKEVEPIYPGDIGCYTLGVNPPLEAVDTCICMGGSFGIANGLAHVIDAPVIAHLGDSTFFHAGIPPLIDAVYNKANITMVILDNSATAMTGFQPHPGTGYTATGDETAQLKIEDIARACGVKFVEVIDPFDLKKATEAIEKAIRFDGPAVIVSRRLCTIIEQREKRERKEKIIPYHIDQNKCNIKCDACVKLLGCPAIIKRDGKTMIDSSLCPGCGICAQICPYKAIIQE
jgi:indolepyruvate ferredoxin oxidoreductase alpha subunit